MRTLHHVLILLLVLFVSNEAFGQKKKNKADFAKANEVLNKYLNTVNSGDSMLTTIDTNWLNNLPDILSDEKLIFDIPVKNTLQKQDKIQDLSKEDRLQSDFISIYRKTVPLEIYQNTLKSFLDTLPGNKFEYKLIVLKRNVLEINEDTNKVIKQYFTSEIKKVFIDDTLHVATDMGRYIIKIQEKGDDFKIVRILKNDEPQSKSDINISIRTQRFKNKKKGNSTSLILNFPIIHDEFINNDTIIDTISTEMIHLGVLANRARIKVDTAYDPYFNIRYGIPDNWKNEGMLVNNQPLNGFDLNLKPYLWNGWAYSISFSGGITSAGNIDTRNFSSDNSFNPLNGYKIGVGFRLTKFFWEKNLAKKRPLLGIGTGVSANFSYSQVKSNGFDQNQYKFQDKAQNKVDISYFNHGGSFIETDIVGDLAFPIYLEFLWKFADKVAISIDFGVSAALPAMNQYEASGTFSRWGYYPENSKPIKDDQYNNYFTNRDTTYKGNVEYTWYIIDMVGSLNFYFDIFGKKSDNSLKVGFFFSAPITPSNEYEFDRDTQADLPEYAPGYWISIENDQYNSVAYGKKNIYEYYTGVTIGINFVKFKAR